MDLDLVFFILLGLAIFAIGYFVGYDYGLKHDAADEKLDGL